MNHIREAFKVWPPKAPYTEYPSGVIINTDVVRDFESGIRNIKDGVVQLIAQDPPYYNTDQSWDTEVILTAQWMRTEYWRVVDPPGVIALFGNEGYLLDMIMRISGFKASGAADMMREIRWLYSLLETKLITNGLTPSELTRYNKLKGELSLEMERTFRYLLVWDKCGSIAQQQHSKNRPVAECEYIGVFSRGTANHKSVAKLRMRYYLAGATSKGVHAQNGRVSKIMRERPGDVGKLTEEFTNVPGTVLRYPLDNATERPYHGLNSNKKPIKLMQRVISLYTLKGDLVLDPTAGSGSTPYAAMLSGRYFIAYEMDPEQYKDIKKLIEAPQMRKFGHG